MYGGACGLALPIQRDVLHHVLIREEVQLSLVLLVEDRHLLDTVHYLGEISTLVILCFDAFVFFGQLIVECRPCVICQLELDALHGLYRLNVDDADAFVSSCQLILPAACNLQEEFTLLGSISDKTKLFTTAITQKLSTEILG